MLSIQPRLRIKQVPTDALAPYAGTGETPRTGLWYIEHVARDKTDKTISKPDVCHLRTEALHDHWERVDHRRTDV